MLRIRHKKTIAIIAGFICVVLLGTMKGPKLFHAYYRGGISDAEIQAKRSHYNSLANRETFDESLSQEEWQAVHGERVQLYYWLRVRGSVIDGGHHGWAWPRQWGELFQYWNDAKSFN
jgi:hypothetical protein